MKRPALVLAVLALVGCEAKPPARAVATEKPAPSFKASCSRPRLGVCTEYSDEAFGLGEELLKTGCTESRGAWSPARCPPEGRLGSCATAGSHRLYYRGGDLDFSAATAAKDCTELYQGSWAAN